jgi:hypothetical protein
MAIYVRRANRLSLYFLVFTYRVRNPLDIHMIVSCKLPKLHLAAIHTLSPKEHISTLRTHSGHCSSQAHSHSKSHSSKQPNAMKTWRKLRPKPWPLLRSHTPHMCMNKSGVESTISPNTVPHRSSGLPCPTQSLLLSLPRNARLLRSSILSP